MDKTHEACASMTDPEERMKLDIYRRAYRAGIEAAAKRGREIAHERCMKGQTPREVAEEVENGILCLPDLEETP